MKNKLTLLQLIQAATKNSVPVPTDTTYKVWKVDDTGYNIPISSNTTANCFSELANVTVRLYLLLRELPKGADIAKRVLSDTDCSSLPNVSSKYDDKAVALYFKFLDQSTDKDQLYVKRLANDLSNELAITVTPGTCRKYAVFLPTLQEVANFDEKWIADQWLTMYFEVLNNPPKTRPTTMTNTAVEKAVNIFDRNYYWELKL
jgi:hypothetical protein